jgi:hypothetical protein
LAIRPGILNILVGVNNFWHTLPFAYDVIVKTYENDYYKLLSVTKQQFPDIVIIIGEPFAVKQTTLLMIAGFLHLTNTGHRQKIYRRIRNNIYSLANYF